jgi:hypothetical protein
MVTTSFMKIFNFFVFFSFSSCLTIKTMDRQCESFSRNFSSATGLHKSFMFIRNTRTASSINENSEIFKKFQNLKHHKSEYCLMDIFMLFPQSFTRVWFFWESRLQHKYIWWLQSAFCTHIIVRLWDLGFRQLWHFGKCTFEILQNYSSLKSSIIILW